MRYSDPGAGVRPAKGDGSEPIPQPDGAGKRSAQGNLSRTWELELLISGAVVFALLNLPPVLERGFERLEPQLSRGPGMVLFFGYYYASAIVYALIACFLLHLAARAYWVGLIGLDSVFPHGVRWDNLRLGPISKAVYKKRLPPLSSVIARADDFCSVIFSFAFLIVLYFLISILLTGLIGGIAVAISRLFFGGGRLNNVFLTLMVLVAVVPMLIAALDRSFGERVSTGSPLGRALRRVVPWSYYLAVMPVIGPIQLTLFTNYRKAVIYPVFYTVFFGLLSLILMDSLRRADILEFSSYAYLPEETGANSVDYRYYENQRPPGEVFPRTPSIQADVVRDPFVRLFIPYSPRRHNQAIARECPGVQPLQDEGVRLGSSGAPAGQDSAAAAVLRCLSGLHRVTVNGEARPDLAFHFYTHPRTGIRGIVTYIPADSLPRGSNMLTVHPAPREPGGRRLLGRTINRPPQQPHVIRFWR